MTEQRSGGVDRVLVRSIIEAAIRIAVIAILAVWCYRIVGPFVAPAIWSIIFAVALFPVFTWLRSKLGGRDVPAAVAIVLVAVAILIVPAVLLSTSTLVSLHHITVGIRDGSFTVPPPWEGVEGWPVVGGKVAALWSEASENLQRFLAANREQVEPVVVWLLEQAHSFWSGMLTVLLAFLIAGVLMVNAEVVVGGIRRFAGRLAGEDGEAMVSTAGATIRSVAQGVLGIAVLQALLAGIGMLVVGVPGAGLWAGLLLVVAVVQLPPLLVMAPVIVWVFTSSGVGTAGAVLFALYGIGVSVSDTLLKPLFLGRGVEVPMPVILVGAIGGMIVSGIAGLFIGAVVLALGHKLLLAWMDREDGSGGGVEARPPGEQGREP